MLKAAAVLGFIAENGSATYAKIRDGLNASTEELDAALRGVVARKEVKKDYDGYRVVSHRPAATLVVEPDEDDD